MITNKELKEQILALQNAQQQLDGKQSAIEESIRSINVCLEGIKEILSNSPFELIFKELDCIERKVEVVVADIANETHENDTHERLVHIEDRVKEANMFLQKLNEDTWVYGHAIEKAIASNMQPSQRPRVHFIRCLDRYNTGDLNCGPELFFQDFAVRFSCFYHSIKDIDYTIIRPDDWVILGGGGMIDCNEKYQSEINRVLHTCKHVISWAMGHNHHYSDCIFAWKSIFPIDMTAFELFTTRDWEYNGQRYCPCASCMMPELDIVYEKKRRIAVYEHHQIPIDILPDVEHMTNSAPIHQVLKYIGEAEVLITNSYHGAYWGILMKKKVIIYKPFSNKYEFFKYSPTIYSGNLEEDIARTNVYPEALRECRELNLNLRDEIVKMISEEK